MLYLFPTRKKKSLNCADSHGSIDKSVPAVKVRYFQHISSFIFSSTALSRARLSTHCSVTSEVPDKFSLAFHTKSNQGFTLIEMVMVIIIMGILAVTVLPRFFGSNGYEEYAYRTQVISTLRTIQQKAMQDTSHCYQVAISAKILQQNPTQCQTPPSGNIGNEYVIVTIDTGHDVSFDSDLYFSFDDMGRPFNCNCASSDVVITISGFDNLQVMVNQEGYIYAL